MFLLAFNFIVDDNGMMDADIIISVEDFKIPEKNQKQTNFLMQKSKIINLIHLLAKIKHTHTHMYICIAYKSIFVFNMHIRINSM